MLQVVRNVFMDVFVSSGDKIAKSIFFSDMDKLTLVLHSTKFVATKTDLPEHNKLELSSLTIVQVKQVRVHGARCHKLQE